MMVKKRLKKIKKSEKETHYFAIFHHNFLSFFYHFYHRLFSFFENFLSIFLFIFLFTFCSKSVHFFSFSLLLFSIFINFFFNFFTAFWGEKVKKFQEKIISIDSFFFCFCALDVIMQKKEEKKEGKIGCFPIKIPIGKLENFFNFPTLFPFFFSPFFSFDFFSISSVFCGKVEK